MRFGIALPNYGPLAGPETLGRLARLAEDLGVDSIWLSDHLVAPVGVQSVYPYDRRPDPKPGEMGVIEEFYEPIVTLAYLAGQTRRVLLGIGVGWLAEEFVALDVPFAGRGRRTDDYLGVLKALWAGGEASYEGRAYRLPPVRTGPRPVQRPHPPLWIAGNSDAALARAVRAGDGLHVIDASPAELQDIVARLRQ